MSSEPCTNASSFARTRRRSSPSFKRVWEVSRINHILRVHGHTILEEQSAAAVYDEIGQRSLKQLFPGLTEDSMTQATLSAGQSGFGFKRARDIAAPAHLGAKPRTRVRSETQFGQAFSLSRSWRRVSLRSSTIASLEQPSSASQDEDSDDMDFPAPRKSAAPSAAFTAHWQQVTRIEDLCHDQVSVKYALPPGRVRGKCLDTARLHYQRSEKTR